MPIDKQPPLDLTAEADQLHHESMRVFEEQVSGRRLGETRRGVLRKAGIGGALLTVGSMAGPVSRFLPAAFAKSRLDDTGIIEFAAGVEFAAVAAYQTAIDSAKLDGAARRVATSFQSHHREHGRAFNTITKVTTEKPNAQVVVLFSPKLKAARDQNAVLEVAYTIEEAAAATHLFALGVLQDKTNAQAAATILPVESQHAVVLAQMLKKKLDTYMPSFQNSQRALDPNTYPA